MINKIFIEKDPTKFLGKHVKVITSNKKIFGKIVSVFPEYFILENKKSIFRCLWNDIIKIF